jgi:hypothetical protein
LSSGTFAEKCLKCLRIPLSVKELVSFYWGRSYVRDCKKENLFKSWVARSILYQK